MNQYTNCPTVKFDNSVQEQTFIPSGEYYLYAPTEYTIKKIISKSFDRTYIDSTFVDNNY